MTRYPEECPLFIFQGAYAQAFDVRGGSLQLKWVVGKTAFWTFPGELHAANCWPLTRAAADMLYIAKTLDWRRR